MHFASYLMLLASVLTPAKPWVAPGQPMIVKVQADGPSRLVLSDFGGKDEPPVSRWRPASRRST